MIGNVFSFADKKFRRLFDSGSDCTDISTQEISIIVQKLKLQRNHDSTRKMYYTVWKLFNNFYLKLDMKPSTWEDRLVFFVGYLIHKKRQTSTVKSYISAIRCVLMEDKYELAEDKFLLTSLIRACKYQSSGVKLHRPIQKKLLQVILARIDYEFDIMKGQPYLAMLYKVLFATTYYGLFRIGELTRETSQF